MTVLNTRFASEAVKYTHMFTTTGLCSPSRANILTGQYTHRTGVWTNNQPDGGFTAFKDRSTIATWLHDAGYTTALIGKYINDYQSHLDYIPPGWDRWFAYSGGYTTFFLSDDGQKVLYKNTYSTDLLTEKLIEFIRSTKTKTTGKPFFAYFAPFAPHLSPLTNLPLPAPRHEGTCFKVKARPPSFNIIGNNAPYFFDQPPLDQTEIDYLDTFHGDQLCTLRALDEAISNIIDTLESEGIDGNTAIIYMGDNGYNFGEHRLPAKWELYDESVRVPFFIRYKALFPENVVSNKLVANVDVAPTIADIAKAQIPATHRLDGQSLVGAEDDDDSRDYVFLEQKKPRRLAGPGSERVPVLSKAIRTDRFKYIMHEVTPLVEELYDLSADPYEINNVINDAGYIATAKSMSERLASIA